MNQRRSKKLGLSRKNCIRAKERKGDQGYMKSRSRAVPLTGLESVLPGCLERKRGYVASSNKVWMGCGCRQGRVDWTPNLRAEQRVAVQQRKTGRMTGTSQHCFLLEQKCFSSVGSAASILDGPYGEALPLGAGYRSD